MEFDFEAENKERKRRILIILSIIFVFFIVVSYSKMEFINYGRNLILRGIGLPATSGKVSLTIDGKKYVVDSTTADCAGSNSKLKKGKYTVTEGEYGGPYLRLMLHPEFTANTITPQLDKGIEINFGIASSNWWYRHKIDLEIDLDRLSEDSLQVSLVQKISGDQKGSLFGGPQIKKVDTVIALDTSSMKPDFWLTLGP